MKQIKNNLSEEIEIFTKEIEDIKKIGILEPKKKKIIQRILDINPLSRVWFENAFFHSMGYWILIPMKLSFHAQKFLILIKSNIFFCCLCFRCHI